MGMEGGSRKPGRIPLVDFYNKLGRLQRLSTSDHVFITKSRFAALRREMSLPKVQSQPLEVRSSWLLSARMDYY